MYKNHGHFHEGDAGLDLFIIENQIPNPGETSRIKLGISCENMDQKAIFINAQIQYIKNTPKIM